MWMLLSGGLRRWALLSVALPVLARLAPRLGAAIETRRGPNPVTNGLVTIGTLAGKKRPVPPRRFGVLPRRRTR
jgi:hypothetical protein